MSNGDDTAEACCAIGLCCGGEDDVKQIQALMNIIANSLGHHPSTQETVTFLIDHFDLTPKSWGWGVLMRKIGAIARTFPYV